MLEGFTCSMEGCVKQAAVMCINGQWMCRACCDKILARLKEERELANVDHHIQGGGNGGDLL